MFGLDLSAIPEKIYNFLGIVPIPSFASWLIIIPVISAATAFLSSWLTQKIGPTAITQQGVQQTASMKVMNFLGPYMSYSIAMVVPAGLGLYWIVTNILTIFQTLIINKVYNPHEYMRKMEAEEAAAQEKAQEIRAVGGLDRLQVHAQEPETAQGARKAAGRGKRAEKNGRRAASRADRGHTR